jgi:autotransporter strand-loop-strand O-heptosyltransferase
MLKKQGITPVSVDLHEVFGIDGYWNCLPKNSLIKVGMDFKEVIRWIEHCEFFIGVSSGLAWVANGLNKKVVMITGTTEEGNEFNKNCTVVSNRTICNGCFNKSELYKFNSGNWLWCPVNGGTERDLKYKSFGLSRI